jgi:hypothetical protein
MFYIYAYLREDGTPYYVGKGKDGRVNSKQRTVPKPTVENRIVIWNENISDEKEAFELEKHYIALYGRKDNNTGILRNRTDGGEGVSGRVPTEEFIQKMKAIKRAGNPNYRGPKSLEHRAKIAARNRARVLGQDFSAKCKAGWARKKERENPSLLID